MIEHHGPGPGHKLGNTHEVHRIGPGYSLKLIIGIFESAQGDPGTLEELLVQATVAQIPYWRLASRVGFVNQTKRAILTILNRPERHVPVDLSTIIDGEKEPEHSLLRVHRRISQLTAKIGQAHGRIPENEELRSLIPQLTVELISRDWYYLVQREGRPKEGIQDGDTYDPNEDKWFSFISYYALGKVQNEEGKWVRRSTGTREMNKVYGMIGDYLELVLTRAKTTGRNDLLGGNKYPDVYETDQPVYDMLMEMLAVYNYRQANDLKAPERQIWTEEVKDYFASRRQLS